MAGLHGAIGWLTVAATIAVLVAALPGSIGRAASRRWIDRAILVQVVSAALGCAVGIVVALTDHGPSETLHFVYGAVVLGGLPAVRYAVHRNTGRRFAGWIAVAALVVMGALLRSFMTGR
jgi:hypothetical protein